MSFKQTKAGALIEQFCKDNKEMSTRGLASLVMEKNPNIGSYEKIRSMVRQYRGERGDWCRRNFRGGVETSKTTKQNTEEVTQDKKGNTNTVTSKSVRIKTLEDLIKHCCIDLEEWEIERHIVNKWEVGAKNNKNDLIVAPLYQVKAWLKRKTDYIAMRNVRNEIIADIRKASRNIPKIIHHKAKDSRLLEISVADAHLGKLCWGAETGDDYDLSIAAAEYRKAVQSLVSSASPGVDRILYVVGNDFYHYDTINNETTAGTLQDTDTRWQKMFRAGRMAIQDTAIMLSSIAPVDIVCVQGNHDWERVFYLGEVMEAVFSNNKNINVDCTVKPRKYYQYHSNLIGFTHGDKEKITDLPLIMASEQPALWAATKFREIHCGHIHKKKDIKWVDIDEHRGVRVRYLPSISGIDSWHNTKGYLNQRSAEAIEWTRKDGIAATYSHNL